MESLVLADSNVDFVQVCLYSYDTSHHTWFHSNPNVCALIHRLLRTGASYFKWFKNISEKKQRDLILGILRPLLKGWIDFWVYGKETKELGRWHCIAQLASHSVRQIGGLGRHISLQLGSQSPPLRSQCYCFLFCSGGWLGCGLEGKEIKDRVEGREEVRRGETYKSV